MSHDKNRSVLDVADPDRIRVGTRAAGLRDLLAPLALVLFSTMPASAANWGETLFEQSSHDFRTVAQNADVVHRFHFRNRFEEDIRVLGAKSSCGCTSPEIETTDDSRTLKTGETGAIVARLNTRAFSGHKSATITVDLEFTNAKGVKHRDEVQLQVKSHIATDIALSPEAVEFLQVAEGTEHERTVTVTRRNRSDWRILKADSPNEHLEVALSEKHRSGQRVAYELDVRLKATAPVGYFHSPITLETNDPNQKQVTLDVSGQVRSSVAVRPAQLVIADAAPNKIIKKKLVVTSDTPLKILDISCPDGRFDFRFDKQPSKMHIVEVAFHADGRQDKVSQAFRIRTDRAQDVLVAHATVLPRSTESVAARPSNSAD